MNRIKINNWSWVVEDANWLYPWFDKYKEHLAKGLIKTGSERDVFRVDSDAGKVIVKYSHPSSILQKVRSSVSPKLASEFDALSELREREVPVVKVLGWGASGSESMLLTEEVTPSETLKNYWFSHFASSLNGKQEFLVKYARFLQTFFHSNLYHPDFHPGNIIINTETGGMFMLDPYGLKRREALSEEQLFEMLCIIGAFRGELTDDDGTFFLRFLETEFSAFNAVDLWEKILIHEAEKSRKLCVKRKHTLLTDARYSKVFKLDRGDVRIMRSMTGELLASPDNLDNIIENSDEYMVFDVNAEQAEAKWAEALFCRIHRLPHQIPVLWFSAGNTNHRLYIRKKVETVLNIEEIEKRFALSGIKYPENITECITPLQ